MGDGSLILAGYNAFGPPDSAAAMKIDSNGNLDTSWGVSGVADLHPAGNTESEALSVTLLPDGSAYVGGSATNGDLDGFVTRLTSTGNTDTSFGASGYVFSDANPADDDYVNEVTIGRDGRLIGVGSAIFPTDRGTFAAWTATAVDDYGAGHTWTGASQGAFGTCMTGLTGATGTGWATDACLTSVDGPSWHAIPATVSSGSIATTLSGVTGSTASFHFGFRTLAAQPAGTYLAPITFEVIAPS